MSKLKSNHKGSKVQPEVISLVHDEVVSLCHRMYSSISGIEIDGIICISLLDTKEQQVVKIHKTLKSVVADVARNAASARNRAYPKIASILSAGSPANIQEQRRYERSEGEVPNFQKDISTLNDLLQASNAIIRAETEKKTGSVEDKKSKRKRKHPQHRSDLVYDAENEDSQDMQERIKGNSCETKDTSGAENVDKIIVKEETEDPSYENSVKRHEIILSCPKVLDYSSLSCSSKDNEREHSENDAPLSDIIEHSKSIERENAEPPNQTENEIVPVIKAENTDQDSQYGIITAQSSVVDQESDQNHDPIENENSLGTVNDNASNDKLQTDSNTYERLRSTVRKSQETEKHWLYGIAKKGSDTEDVGQDAASANESTKLALMDKYHQKGSIAHKGYPREVQRQEKDPLGRSWIEMVKDNVTKYQAALMRSANKSDGDEPAAGSASGLLKSLASPRTSSLLNADHLKALLKEPPIQVDHARLMVDSSQDMEIPSKTMKDNSLSLNPNISGSDISRSASVSPAPVVKIEIDEDHEAFDVSEESPTETDFTRKHQMTAEGAQEGSKPHSGKLESRYPALFNQLQLTRSSSGQPSIDQPESLVNRLPFISFQELFATANPESALPRLSDVATKQLLEKAKVKPYQRVTPPKKKTVWKWKKRFVRPKNSDGQVIANSAPVAPEAARSETVKQTKSLGINMSAKKTFGRKRQKLDDSSDKEWTPPDVTGGKQQNQMDDSQDNDSSDNIEIRPTKTIKTRLSTGDKPRINFAELENSDIELEDDIKEEPVEPIELVSAYCKNNCGMKCTSFAELKIHEDQCVWSPGAVGGAEGSVAAEGIGTGNSGDNYKCTLCGLDFNQEYRWHYHMVKVHGVSADQTVLFR